MGQASSSGHCTLHPPGVLEGGQRRKGAREGGRGGGEITQLAVPTTVPNSPFLGTAPSSWQGHEGGPEEGKGEGGRGH